VIAYLLFNSVNLQMSSLKSIVDCEVFYTLFANNWGYTFNGVTVHSTCKRIGGKVQAIGNLNWRDVTASC